MSRLLNFDENGFYIFGGDIYDVPEDVFPKENQYLAMDNERISFARPKLVGGVIVEGKEAWEFEEEEMNKALTPTPEEQAEAEWMIKTINLLMDLGVLI